MTAPANVEPLVRMPNGNILQIDGHDGTRRPCVFNAFPNITSSLGRESAGTYGWIWAQFSEYDGVNFPYTPLTDRLLTPQNSNIPITPFLTMHAVRTDAPRSFWLCCSCVGIFADAQPTFGECSIFGQKYGYADCHDPVDGAFRRRIWKLAYVVINSVRRVFVDGVDTGIWRSTGVIHEP